jgi:hypothetical protein
MDEFVDWYCSEPRLALNRIVVLRYLESRQLAPGTVNLRLGAVRRLAYEAADCGLLSADLAAGIRRVKGVKKLGVRLGNWLTAEQGQALWQVPDHRRLKGKRDRLIASLARNPYVGIGVPAIAVSFFALMALLSITNLSFAVPATAFSCVLETALAKYILKEHIGWRRWAGASLVGCGVLLVSLGV